MNLSLTAPDARAYLCGSAREARDQHLETAQEWYDSIKHGVDAELLSLREIRAIIAITWGDGESQALRP